ncbi:MAG: ATP-grasp domain-containing protein [bacterium]
MKLAVIGAASGQLPICLKAREMGLETHCFAWPQGAVCKDAVDFFHAISVTERNAIVEKCGELHIDGVVSNASDLTAETASYVAEKLGLNGTPYRVLDKLHDKFLVRQLSESVERLSKPRYYKYEGTDQGIYPCVVKPCGGSAKAGVSFVNEPEEFAEAVKYARDSSKGDILVEEYIPGKELSIESISFKGKHQVIQITDKESSSAPHFVELGHHQPAAITASLRSRIEELVPRLLQTIGYTDGAAHIEIKYSDDNIYLIEVNLRGGGDEISNKLVQMSSGIDYLRCMIEVALGTFMEPVKVSEPSYAGIYYLCKQSKDRLPFFEHAKDKEWFVEGEITNRNLRESHSNYERDGYLIYKSNHRITPRNHSL